MDPTAQAKFVRTIFAFHLKNYVEYGGRKVKNQNLDCVLLSHLRTEEATLKESYERLLDEYLESIAPIVAEQK